MKKDFLIAIAVIAVLFAAYSINRFNLGLSIPDEKRYIQSAREMAVSGDYVTPRYHGDLRFQKPIFFYWLISLSYKIFSPGIFGARFPSILAGVLNVIVIYLFGRLFFSRKAAFFSAMALAASEIFFMYSSFAVPDMVFVLFINLALYFFALAYLGRVKGNFRYLYMYVFMALAMLTKGPQGLLYPMFIVLGFISIRREWGVIKDMKIVFGLVVFFLISAPWFIVMTVLYGKEYIGNVWSLEVLKKLGHQNAVGGVFQATHYFKSAFYYAGMIFLRNLPWSAFLPAAIISASAYGFKEKKHKRGFDFIIVWVSVVFIFIVLLWSTESHYILPLSAPLALFMGVYLYALSENKNLTESLFFKIPFLTAASLFFIALPFWAAFEFYVFDKPVISPEILMLLPAAFMIYAYIRRNSNRILIPVSLIIAAISFFIFFSAVVVSIIKDDSLERFSGDIIKVIKEGDLVGVASGIGYHRLNVYLEDYKVANVPRLPQDMNKFLTAKNVRVFYVTTKEDYENLVAEDVRGHLYVMDKTFKWKRFEKQDASYFNALIRYLLKNQRDLFRQSLRDEIYLISNKPSFL